MRSLAERVLNAIDWPGYGCPVRKYMMGDYVIELAPVRSCLEPPRPMCRIKLTHTETGYSKAGN